MGNCYSMKKLSGVCCWPCTWKTGEEVPAQPAPQGYEETGEEVPAQPEPQVVSRELC